MAKLGIIKDKPIETRKTMGAIALHTAAKCYIDLRFLVKKGKSAIQIRKRRFSHRRVESRIAHMFGAPIVPNPPNALYEETEGIVEETDIFFGQGLP